MKTRIFRVLVCFAVLCALLISLSPIRAKAFATEAAILYVSAAVFCGAAITTLGVQANNASSLLSLSGDASMFLDASGKLLKQGFVDVLRLKNELDEYVYFTRGELLESVRSWLFHSGTVVNHAEFLTPGSSVTLTNGDVLTVQHDCYRVKFVGCSSGKYKLYDWVFSEPGENLTYYLNDSDTLTQGDAISASDTATYRVHRTYQSISEYAASSYPSIGEEYVDYEETTTWRIVHCYEAGLLGVTVADGLEMGTVPLQPITSGARSDVLSDWANKQVWVTFKDNLGLHLNDEVYYPISLGTYDDILGLTQDEALTHAGVLLNPGLDFEEDEEEKYKVMDPYLVESLFQGLTMVETEATAPGGGSSDIVGGEFTLDLTDYFPFCIPFDIYEFLTLLAAEPEAPVFEWVIPVPQMDTEFPISIDLSAWDGVAKLFRTFELLAFIIGLAMVTRDKFIRG